MPTFMDSLGANPQGSISGQPGQTNQDVLGIVNNIKDRDMRDYQNKASFMSNLSIQQDRLRKLYGLDGSEGGQQGMNVMPPTDPNAMTGYQKADIGVKQQGADLDKQKLQQQNTMGEQALGIRSQQEQLNQQKSDQIRDQKQNELAAKIKDSEAKINEANAKLQQAGDDAKAKLDAHTAMAAAVEERHKLEMDQMQGRFDVTSKQHQETIDNLTEQLKQKGKTTTNTTIQGDPNAPTGRTTTTLRGSAADTVNVTGRDGKTYSIPADKVNDKDSDGTPHWTQQSDDSSGNQPGT